MKANRKFVEADEAVSPVIAVILMVAITVVLAATVFVLVSDIGSQSAKSAPQIGWSDDETNDRWQINQAPTQVDWDAFQIKMSGATDLFMDLNADAAAAAGVNEVQASYCALGSDSTPTGCGTNDLTGITGTMSGGDFLDFCATAEETDVTVTLIHTESNAIAHQFEFSTVRAC